MAESFYGSFNLITDIKVSDRVAICSLLLKVACGVRFLKGKMDFPPVFVGHEGSTGVQTLISNLNSPFLTHH